MKNLLPAFLGMALLLSACEANRSPGYGYARSRNELGGTSAPPPRRAVGTRPMDSRSVSTAAVQGSLPPPDAEVIYQRQESDAFGSSTYTSRTQVRGPVVEEVRIGNQRVGPGYAPAGTTWVYDPITGRRIPVRRH